MIGFKPLAAGPLASGPIQSPGGLSIGLPSGTSRRYGFTPIPGYNLPDPVPEKFRPPIRPIWDIARESGRYQPAKPAEPPAPRPVPMPPASLFEPRRAPVPLQPSALPSFQQFVPQNPVEFARHLQDVQDMGDAMAALQGLYSKTKVLH